MEPMINEDEFRRHSIRVAGALGAHVSHIESHESSAGIPDLNLFLMGVDLWVELKVLKNGRVKMRPTQRRWHKDRAEHGGQSWVVCLDIATQNILTLPGDKAAALGPSEAEWKRAAAVSNVPELAGLFITLARRVVNGRSKQGPNSDRAPKVSGSPASSLPPGGQTVGGDHWLLDKP